MQKDNYKLEFTKRLTTFSLSMIKFCETIRSDRSLWSIADQLIRSATSIGANVVEAKSSSSKREYINYFQIALKSANETKYWLYLIAESSEKFKTQSDIHLKEADEISKILAAGIITMKGKREI
ncbi:MAG: four helix bundle protein [Patescibacteria group bacterium]